ncbi:MAG: 2-oxoacid:acceptor oxidoreductase subunit alpha [Candidatus Gottesmanbacteria bacterium]
MKTDITWAIGGEAGFGIVSSGTMLSKTFSRAGYGVIANNEYPSLIRGGHNFVSVRITTSIVHAPKKSIQFLIALNKETVDLHKADLENNAYLVYDEKDYAWKKEEFNYPVTLISVPFSDLVKQKHGDAVMRNTIALGVTMFLLGKDISFLTRVIHDQFKVKGEMIVAENIDIATSGYEYVKEHFPMLTDLNMAEGTVKEPQLVMNASEAVALGAIAGGMKFAAIYPMTPINALITLFADHAEELGIVYKQPEDEIAGINMAIGASLGGVRSMVATSGGGFALMVEAISMAGIMEVPVVVNLGMRPGPATGMPTWTEQGELHMVLRAGHGEFPRIILAPGDVEESFILAKFAFEVAEQFQTPVFILTDKYLNETLWQLPRAVLKNQAAVGDVKNTADMDAIPFKRYDISTPSGISKRSVPGEKDHEYIANSYEHDEHGFTTEESAMRKAMVDKRLRKMKAILQIAPAPAVYGEENADITFVSFGSLKGVILEAMRELGVRGVKIKLIHFSWVYPFVEETVKKLLTNEKRLVSIEQNATGQLASLIRELTGVAITEQWLKYDGRQWTTEEIVLRVKGNK